MYLSVFDIFKVGVGPSSSHTMGPMLAANQFIAKIRANLKNKPDEFPVTSVQCILYGSLALTGKGHATDRAVIIGLNGIEPATLDLEIANETETRVHEHKELRNPELPTLKFDPETDLIFDFGPPKKQHANAIEFKALDEKGKCLLKEIYFSIGGGFIATAAQLKTEKSNIQASRKHKSPNSNYPYPFVSAAEMLKMGKENNITIADMKRANELLHFDEQALNEKLGHIWQVMDETIERGLEAEGILPGGLEVKRRARAIKQQLEAEQEQNIIQPQSTNEWLCVYAMAVNEENAAGGRIVTSPTNGAAGVVPAVMRYYRDHCSPKTPAGTSKNTTRNKAKTSNKDQEGMQTFLLTAAAIGGLIKHNASISGAEMGCQGEVGSASAMAAAGLCAALGGTNEQIENAAEIALEHHLGMTCDPVKGLVQVPCIERNGMGAIKAVSAAALALRGDGEHFMPLDNCIETMKQTGLDMNTKYKETSLGGLAVNFPEC